MYVVVGRHGGVVSCLNPDVERASENLQGLKLWRANYFAPHKIQHFDSQQPLNLILSTLSHFRILY